MGHLNNDDIVPTQERYTDVGHKKQTRNRQETDKKQTIGDTSCPYLNPSMDDVAAGDRPPHGYEGAKDCV